MDFVSSCVRACVSTWWWWWWWSSSSSSFAIVVLLSSLCVVAVCRRHHHPSPAVGVACDCYSRLLSVACVVVGSHCSIVSVVVIAIGIVIVVVIIMVLTAVVISWNGPNLLTCVPARAEGTAPQPSRVTRC